MSRKNTLQTSLKNLRPAIQPITFKTNTNKMATAIPQPINQTPVPIPDLSSKTQDQKIDILINIAQNQNRSMSNLDTSMQKMATDVSKMTQLMEDNLAIKEQLKATNGKIQRLQKGEDKLQEKIEQIEQRELSKNLIFLNVPEEGIQSSQNLAKRIYNVLSKDMKIPSENIFSSQYLAGEIRIDSIFRVGKPSQGRPRPISVRFLTKLGRDIVYDRKYTANLKSKSNPIIVVEQYITAIREKRTALYDDLKKLRDINADPSTKISIRRDKIIVNNVPKDTFRFQQNPLPESSPISTSYNLLYHSKECSIKDSFFQGHAMPVSTRLEAIAARNAIFQTLPHADHVIYAYNLTKGEGQSLYGHDDDGEIGASQRLKNTIIESGKTNVFVAVTRHKKGGNIGPIRFEMVEEIGKTALQTLSTTYHPTLFKSIL